jgi:hypothetical protein
MQREGMLSTHERRSTSVSNIGLLLLEAVVMLPKKNRHPTIFLGTVAATMHEERSFSFWAKAARSKISILPQVSYQKSTESLQCR